MDPNDNVIGGNTYTSAGVDDINPYQWTENMKLPDGSRPHLDMWGHNPCGFTLPDLNDPPSRAGGHLQRPAAPDRGARQDLPRPAPEAVPGGVGRPEGFKDKDIGYGLKQREATSGSGPPSR